MATGFRAAVLFVAAIVAVCGSSDSRPEEQGHKTLTAVRAAVPIIVDGKLGDWPKDAEKAELALDPEEAMYRAEVKLAWDEKNLYAAFKVASGRPMRNAGYDPATAFKTGDTVEVFLSVNDRPLADRVSRGENLDTAKAGDYRILMTMLGCKKPVVFGYDFVNPAKAKSPLVIKMVGPTTIVDCAGIVLGAALAVAPGKLGDVSGYVAEARLPWSYFRNHETKAGERLLFDLAVNFANQAGTMNMGKAYWNSPGHMTTDIGFEAQVFPERWGWLVLK